MPHTHSDPFESFREAREQEGFRKCRQTDRAVYANRIARLLDGMETGQKGASVTPAGIALSDVLSLIHRLHAAGGIAAQEQRLRIAAFLENVLALGRRLLDEDALVFVPPAQEFEVDFNSLFEFMLNPDVDGLKRGR